MENLSSVIPASFNLNSNFLYKYLQIARGIAVLLLGANRECPEVHSRQRVLPDCPI